MGVIGREIRRLQHERAKQEAQEANKKYKERQRMLRKTFTKQERQKVYEKYGCRCAYCGKELDIKDMQIDHAHALAGRMYGTVNEREKVTEMIEDGSIHGMDNLMPACRACNFYKGTNDIEGFRQKILQELEHTCRDSFQTRLAMQYGMITYTPWNGKFYFETINN